MSDLWAEWMDTEVAVTVAGGRDEWGADVPGATTTVQCKVSQANQLVRNSEGIEVLSTATLQAPLSALQAFEPGGVVDVLGRVSQVISVAVQRGDADLEGITVSIA